MYPNGNRVIREIDSYRNWLLLSIIINILLVSMSNYCQLSDNIISYQMNNHLNKSDFTYQG